MLPTREQIKELTSDELELLWIETKTGEVERQMLRRQVETELLERNEILDGYQGTTHLSQVKISSGVTKTYDQAGLAQLSEVMPAALFPFKVEYKPDTKGIKYLQEHHPDQWARIAPLITEKPKKAQFQIKPQEA